MPKKSALPLIILAAGFLWHGLCVWLGKRSFLAPKEGVTPVLTPQKMALYGVLGLVICMVAAALAAVKKWGN